jgi:hypothetical protein
LEAFSEISSFFFIKNQFPGKERKNFAASISRRRSSPSSCVCVGSQSSMLSLTCSISV